MISAILCYIYVYTYIYMCKYVKNNTYNSLYFMLCLHMFFLKITSVANLVKNMHIRQVEH